MALTAAAIKQAKSKEKQYKLYDEKGLFLLIKKTGSKYWRFKYKFAGKEKLLAVGVYPDVTLAMARKSRDEARRQLSEGIDPSQLKQDTKDALKVAANNSFESVAKEWMKKRGKKSATGDQRMHGIMNNYLFPTIGRSAVSEITPPQLLAALRKIESRGAIHTAGTAKHLAGQVFRYAIASGLAERDPSGDLKGALSSYKPKHFAAITEADEAGRLMHSINSYSGADITRFALKLSALLFCRPGELRHLEWGEINWQERQIEIPAHKMKMNEPHIIPISSQAFKILEELHHRKRGDYVHPSRMSAKKPMSENTVRMGMRRMGYGKEVMTAHGFRAMARTLLEEKLKYPISWIEQQLAHAVRDVHGRAYNRTKHLDERREMMQKWADYLDSLAYQAEHGNVVPGAFPSAGHSNV